MWIKLIDLFPASEDLFQHFKTQQCCWHPHWAGDQDELQGVLVSWSGQPFGDWGQRWEGGVRLNLVPVCHAGVIRLHLVGVTVVHIDHDGLLEWNGVVDVEAVSGAA